MSINISKIDVSKPFELTGKLKVISGIQSFDSGFTKREFVIEGQDSKYPQLIKFECVKDRTALTDNFQVDDLVRVTFDIRGNQFKERFYVNLVAWQLDRIGPPKPANPEPQEAETEKVETEKIDALDEIPF